MNLFDNYVFLLDPAHPEQQNRFPADFRILFAMAPFANSIFKLLAPLGYIRYASSLQMPPTYLYPEVIQQTFLFLWNTNKITRRIELTLKLHYQIEDIGR